MIYNGIYTITSTTGEHRTFRISTPDIKKDEKVTIRFASLLTGPNNTQDYTSFALLTEQEEFKVFKKYKDHLMFNKHVKLLNDIFKENSQYIKLGFKIHVSRNCMRCNRVLTVESSVTLGFGPICATQGK